jgi:hypothetical protein
MTVKKTKPRKPRETWERKPMTQVKQSDKAYDRKKGKKEWVKDYV